MVNPTWLRVSLLPLSEAIIIPAQQQESNQCPLRLMRAAAVSQRPHTCCRLTAGPSLSLLVTNLGSHDNQWHTQVVAQHRWIKGEGHATPTSRRLGRVCRPHLLWIDVSLKVRHHCKETEGKALLIAIDHSILVY